VKYVWKALLFGTESIRIGSLSRSHAFISMLCAALL
jgi:hypothetical protein